MSSLTPHLYYKSVKGEHSSIICLTMSTPPHVHTGLCYSFCNMYDDVRFMCRTSFVRHMSYIALLDKSVYVSHIYRHCAMY